MKTRVLLFVASLLLLLPLSALAEVPPRPTTAGFVFDYQNVIDDEIEQEINNFSFELQRQGVMELFILTVPTIGDLAPYEYGVELFRQWGIGNQSTNNGMIIYATTDMGQGNNKVRITTGYGLEGEYTDGYTGELLDTYMVPYLEQGDYTTAFAKVVEAIRAKEGIDYSWQQPEVFEMEDMYFWDKLLLGAAALGGLWYLLVLIRNAFRKMQGRYYDRVERKTGKDIRSKGYKAHVAKQEEKRAREAGRSDPASPYFDPHYSSSSDSSSDSYSGGGGDSGGGGSDRSF